MSTSPITQDDRSVAQRDLRMAALNLRELEALIERHRDRPPFSSQVIVSAARQMLEAKRVMMTWLTLSSASSPARDGERVPRLPVRA